MTCKNGVGRRTGMPVDSKSNFRTLARRTSPGSARLCRRGRELFLPGHRLAGRQLGAHEQVLAITLVDLQHLLARLRGGVRVAGLLLRRSESPARVAVLRDATREGRGGRPGIAAGQGQLAAPELERGLDKG